MREILYRAISQDSVLASLGLVYGSVYAGDVDTPEERPFLNIRWGFNNPGRAQVTQSLLTVWVHDRRDHDYVRIDQIMVRLRELLVGLETQKLNGSSIVCVEWTGDSQDLIDDGHNTITKNASFNIVGSGR